MSEDTPRRRWTEAEMETRYVTDEQPISQRDLAKLAGWSRKHVCDLCVERGWVAKRKQAMSQIVSMATARTVRDKAKDLAAFQDGATEIALEIVGKLRRAARKTSCVDTLRQIASTLKDTIGSGHLVMGQPTEILRTIDDELALLEADIEDGKDGAI